MTNLTLDKKDEPELVEALEETGVIKYIKTDKGKYDFSQWDFTGMTKPQANRIIQKIKVDALVGGIFGIGAGLFGLFSKNKNTKKSCKDLANGIGSYFLLIEKFVKSEKYQELLKIAGRDKDPFK